MRLVERRTWRHTRLQKPMEEQVHEESGIAPIRIAVGGNIGSYAAPPKCRAKCLRACSTGGADHNPARQVHPRDDRGRRHRALDKRCHIDAIAKCTQDKAVLVTMATDDDVRRGGFALLEDAQKVLRRSNEMSMTAAPKLSRIDLTSRASLASPTATTATGVRGT
jgi:hypothetical protein